MFSQGREVSLLARTQSSGVATRPTDAVYVIAVKQVVATRVATTQACAPCASRRPCC